MDFIDAPNSIQSHRLTGILLLKNVAYVGNALEDIVLTIVEHQGHVCNKDVQNQHDTMTSYMVQHGKLPIDPVYQHRAWIQLQKEVFRLTYNSIAALC